MGTTHPRTTCELGKGGMGRPSVTGDVEAKTVFWLFLASWAVSEALDGRK